MKCLQEAENKGISSISSPAIGTGNLGISAKSCADAMLSAIRDFSDKQPTSLQLIKMVVFQTEMIKQVRLATKDLRELNISPLDAFRLTCVIDTLPTEWRAFLKTCNHSVIEPFNLQNQVQLHLNGQNVLLSKAESKLIYKEIRNRSITPPTAQLKYNAQFASDELDWRKIYSLPHRVALDAKSREFQYKLLNRCLASNVLLSKIGIIPSSACSFCGEADESLEHLFL